MQCQTAKLGHTSRGISGALYLKSATAGVHSFFEGRSDTAEPCSPALKSGSCAIEPCEPCQVGNQAALSSKFNVPRGSLLRAGGTKIALM